MFDDLHAINFFSSLHATAITSVSTTRPLSRILTQILLELGINRDVMLGLIYSSAITQVLNPIRTPSCIYTRAFEETI